ncbi:DUF1853 family protein [Polaribacter cellanae]|uniref:DUF1853 family protein n=1 Tax=Polaribacter cellanae TaxID=2818493 RepID=A0A975CQB4_9FLAO|nr:DUF1853 family protein [Polaribacter cellanae]QTE23380.1 DUF1853 family protein [Polaribacter cellanae]
MHEKTTKIQNRYDGFLQTNGLWNNKVIYGLNQFYIENTSVKINIEINEKLRLGKYIERFVSFQIAQEKNIEILAENIQIQQEKRTLGELDCILLKDGKPIHLEVIYKFYLYDASIGTSEINHFIGPNRKDSLIEKLTKLKEKQLPLLYSNECASFLKTINLKPNEIEQQVYFKAQLFVPFSDRNINLKQLNNNCIAGFYSNTKELYQFKDCKFYIPHKKDWLLIPHTNIKWLNFKDFKKNSTEYLERQFAPLCWLKKTNGEMEKFFLVWWS